MKRFILSSLVVGLAVVSVGVFPSAAETDSNGMLGSRYITTKFISKEFGGDIARHSLNRRFQGIQIDTSFFPQSNMDFITELSYAQVGSQDKAWVFDALVNPTVYKSVNPHIKLLAGATFGISTTKVKQLSSVTEYSNTELVWGLNTGAELSQGRFTALLGIDYNWMDEFGDGIEVGIDSNFSLTEKVSLNSSFAYEHNSDALAFGIGLSLHLFN
ncbi:hypothetical protein [Candidatus Mycalebacterium sp.]